MSGIDDAYLGVLKKERNDDYQSKNKYYRTTATVVGIVYILGFVVGRVGIGLFQSILCAPDHLSTVSANSMLLGFGAVPWLMAVIGDAGHGVLMFPVLKQHSERMAIGYLAARIVDTDSITCLRIGVCDKQRAYSSIRDP